MEEIVCGPHAVAAAVRAGRARKVLVSRTVGTGKAMQAARQAAHGGVPVERAEPARIERLAGGAACQGIVAACRAAPAPSDWKAAVEGAPAPRTLLMLDGVKDPRNFGACLRTAHAFGANGVLVPRHGAAPLSAAARKAASGAAETVGVFRVGNLPHVVLALKRMGFTALAASAQAGRTVYDADLTGDIVWILGGEGDGVRRILVDKSDMAVRIPMRSEAESLNVSVAVGVCLAEGSRQRMALCRDKPA